MHLPLASLDRLSLRLRLDEIGRLDEPVQVCGMSEPAVGPGARTNAGEARS